MQFREPRQAEVPTPRPPAAVPPTVQVHVSHSVNSAGVGVSPPPIHFHPPAPVLAPVPVARSKAAFAWRNLVCLDVVLPLVAALIVLIVLLAWAT